MLRLPRPSPCEGLALAEREFVGFVEFVESIGFVEFVEIGMSFTL
jgi:hypothetical protein